MSLLNCKLHVLGRPGWVQIFRLYSGLGWVRQLMGWVGSGHTKWTHGQLWVNSVVRALQPINFVTLTRVTNNASSNWVNLVRVQFSSVRVL